MRNLNMMSGMSWMVAALFNPKTPDTKCTHIIYEHTIACGKLQMIHSIALARTLTHICIHAIIFCKIVYSDTCRRLQAIEQTSNERVNKLHEAYETSYANKHMHTHSFTESMPSNMWNNIVDLNSRFIHAPCDFAFCQRFWLVSFFLLVCECSVFVRPPFFNGYSTWH